MEYTWRWFGKNDKITLTQLKQIGVTGLVTALHNIKNGEIWTPEDIEDLNSYIKSYGMRWSVVESLPVSEEIKYAGPNRDKLIENYKISLENLGKAGIHTICYNFMPIIDWVRTDLFHKWDDGTSSLFFDYISYAYFDLKILKREGAEKEYSKDILEKVEERDKNITNEKKQNLVDTIIVKTQGFVNGNINDKDNNPVEKFRNLLDLFKGIDKTQLRENMKYFLSAIMPVCEKYNMNMCVHPDDPPMQIFGLPRIVTNEEDIDWFLNAVDNPHNGLTFCAGSLSAGKHNDIVNLAKKFVGRTHFVHLRVTRTLPDNNFIESTHLDERLVKVAEIFEKANPSLPMRVDHGRYMLGDEDKGYNAGYSFFGRMFAMGQIQGILSAINTLK